MQFSDDLYGIVKNGCLTLSGYVSSIKTEMDYLVVRDGIKGSEVELRFARASCPVSRIVGVRPAGYISYAASQWMHDVGAVFVQLNHDGTPILATVPKVANISASLRRTQALTTSNTLLGASIARSLIRGKVTGQIEVLKRFSGFPAALETAQSFAERLTPDIDTQELVSTEGAISAVYSQALADIPLKFGRRQSVPEHWKTFGARRSTITGTPRGAVVPAQALTNYLLSTVISEITIALSSVGLDPFLGILHTDKDNRASLAYDLIEPVRPILDNWFIHWLQSATFSKRDFRTDHRGFIRVTHPFTSHLAMTASLWRGLADQLAQWSVQRLTEGEKGLATTNRAKRSHDLRLKFVDTKGEAKRRAIRWKLNNAIQRPIPTTCAECGRILPERRRKFCSSFCANEWHGGRPFDAGLTAIARARAVQAERDDALASRIASEAPTVTLSEWQQQPGWSRERDREMQEWYLSKVLPRLMTVRPMTIGKVLSVGTTYSIAIRFGRKTPSPRHYRALALLAGVEYPF